MPTRKPVASTIRPGLVCLAALLLAACSTHRPSSTGRYSQAQDTAPDRLVDVSQVKDAVPRVEPYSRYGNPRAYVVRGKRYHTLGSSTGYRERGIASWYGTKFHGHRTSSGEAYDMYSMSAAHKTLPLPTYARVTNLNNGRSVIVKVNDRGPFHDNRLIDLSYAAASRLGILGKGTGLVEVEAIDAKSWNQPPAKPRIAASKPKIAGPDTATPAAGATGSASPAHDTPRQPSLYLQLGAFSRRSNAERLQAKLDQDDLPGPLHIAEGTANNQPIYRVRIGPLTSVESADRLTQRLIARGVSAPRVIID